jgi:uncharacterized damage-inducible protein DinB
MESFYQQIWDQLEAERQRLERCLGRLSENQVWKRPRPGVNSIGNLCLHLAGNESHYLGRGIGGIPYTRDRSGEFNAEGGFTAAELLEKLAAARRASRTALENLTLADLERPVAADYPPGATVLGVLLHAAEHYAYHTGQVVLLTRILQAGDERVLEWSH